MNSKLFGSLVAGMLISSPAFADKAAAKKEEMKKDAKVAEHCTSNQCGGFKIAAKDGTVTEAKNSCKGQTVAGATKEQCEADAKGTWVAQK